MNRFNEKTVLVTGAASGMGLAATRRFLDEGAQVVMLDIDEASLKQAAAQFPQDRVLVQVGDTADRNTGAAAIKATLARFGKLDILINNAGIASEGDIMHTSEEDFERVMAVNVAGYFHMAKAAMPELVKTRGAIVMTSSVSGWVVTGKCLPTTRQRAPSAIWCGRWQWMQPRMACGSMRLIRVLPKPA